MTTKQVTVRLPGILVNELDYFVNGSLFRNRSHAMQVIVEFWLENHKGEKKQITIFDKKRGKNNVIKDKK